MEASAPLILGAAQHVEVEATSSIVQHLLGLPVRMTVWTSYLRCTSRRPDLESPQFRTIAPPMTFKNEQPTRL